MIYYKKYKYHEPLLTGTKNKKVDNNIYSFDIETTTYIKLKDVQYSPKDYENFTDKEKEQSEFFSIMYIWMFSINDIVYYGRTWEDLREFLTLLDSLVFS